MLENNRLRAWVGENYNNVNRFHQKILVIGESKHSAGVDYDNENLDTNIQVRDIEDYLENEHSSIMFYDWIGRLLDPEDSKDVWYDVAFTNLIHTILSNGKAQPTVEQIQDVNSFWNYLEELSPDKIIICSSRMWKNWFYEHEYDERVECHTDTMVGISHIFTYSYTKGKALAIGINHPYWNINNDDYQRRWRPEIVKFLEYAQ